ncbi:tyrosine-type recombinase/integrase [Pseudomonas tolaasii]|uniref:tyrosine-type recombinase/integrase n=1 Tax=Pseudomonas tolaasii TaxID=29442 RepID=UPI001C5DC6DA|nr:site-specific integrase [Pseudomonas tolaasii]MBW4792963.1 site-specific integrase [Pseudomonas tolaasii]
MARAPKPLFETYDIFIEQDFSIHAPTLDCVRTYLGEFESELEVARGYAAVRSFLRAFSDNAQTFNSYRSHVERLLLWSLLVKGKPLNRLKRQDAQDYLDFCRNPPEAWIGPVTRSRFVTNPDARESSDAYLPNPKWLPFNLKTRKNDSAEHNAELQYHAANGTLNQIYTVCSRFYEYLVEDGFSETNPFRLLKKGNRFSGQDFELSSSRALTPLQWDYVLDTAESMADIEPLRHERTLFILATLFAMYLRVSDLAGRKNWKPTMGDFRLDAEGNWWYHTVGKGNKAAKIAVRDVYVERYLKRYRRFLGLPELPAKDESTPLIKTLNGRAGLSDRQIRALLQAVFDKATDNMRNEGRALHELESLRCASAHWLRHTSATFDAPLRNPKDLQEDLRHSNLSTTQNTYYHSHDQERAHSVKRIGMRDRG